VVNRSDGAKGFVVVPKRWVVERSLGWMNRDRRLSKDYERTIRSGESWLRQAFVERLLRRLAKKNEKYLRNILSGRQQRQCFDRCR
jgi:putative transposase